jgi:SAM-dependent methyltransferase
MEFRVSDVYLRNCEDYYINDSEFTWREVCSVDKANNIIRLCNEVQLQPTEVIEIGAGDGAILTRLSDNKFGKKLFGLEISRSGIDAIKKRNIERLEDVKMFDGYSIDYEDDYFDLGILSHVLEHVEYPRKLIYEASRIARYLFVEVPLELNRYLGENFILSRTGHINFYSKKTIRFLLQSCNLEVLKQVVTNPSLEVFKYSLRNKARNHYKTTTLFLRYLPNLAPFIFTYHCSLLVKKRNKVKNS